MRRNLADLLEDWAESSALDDAEWFDDAEWSEDAAGLGEVLRDALHDEYTDADADEMSDALDAVLDEMSAAEAFSFNRALRQIERGTKQALTNPLVGQIAQTALPAGAGALGTLIGGPAGTALGSRLGTLAAGALARPGPTATGASIAGSGGAGGRPVQPPTALGALPSLISGAPGPATGPSPAVAGGSAAAAQGLVLTQQPDVLRALLALAMGQHGQRQVGGVRVADVMNMLSSVFGQAAADADELAYLDGEAADAFDGGLGDTDDSGDDAYPAPDFGSGRSLYITWIDAQNEELAS